LNKLYALVIGLLISTSSPIAQAEEINVLCANGARSMLNALAPEFERATNNKITARFAEPAVLRHTVLDGDSFDLIILPAGWEEIHTKIAANPTKIGHTEFGFLVRGGIEKPDTSTNDAVKRTLLGVKSIVYTDPKVGAINGVLFARMIDRLGIADEVNKKSKIVQGPPVEFLINGEVDLAVALSIGLAEFPNLQFVSMPPDFRTSVIFSGAISTNPRAPDAAAALLKFMTAPDAAPLIRAKGYEPG